MRINKDIGFKFRILGLLKSETLGVGHGDLHSDKFPARSTGGWLLRLLVRQVPLFSQLR